MAGMSKNLFRILNTLFERPIKKSMMFAIHVFLWIAMIVRCDQVKYREPRFSYFAHYKKRALLFQSAFLCSLKKLVRCVREDLCAPRSFYFAHYKKKHYFFSLRFLSRLKKRCDVSGKISAPLDLFTLRTTKKSTTLSVCGSFAV